MIEILKMKDTDLVKPYYQIKIVIRVIIGKIFVTVKDFTLLEMVPGTKDNIEKVSNMVLVLSGIPTVLSTKVGGMILMNCDTRGGERGYKI